MMVLNEIKNKILRITTDQNTLNSLYIYRTFHSFFALRFGKQLNKHDVRFITYYLLSWVFFCNHSHYKKIIFFSSTVTVLSVATLTSAQYTEPACPNVEQPKCWVKCNAFVDQFMCYEYECNGNKITVRNQCVVNGHNCRCQSCRKWNIENNGVNVHTLVKLNF